jgi:hypothetical protein
MVKTTAYPLAVLPPAIGAQGEWRIEPATAGIRALHSGSSGELNSFALGGSEIGKRAELARQVAALLAQPRRQAKFPKKGIKVSTLLKRVLGKSRWCLTWMLR